MVLPDQIDYHLPASQAGRLYNCTVTHRPVRPLCTWFSISIRPLLNDFNSEKLKNHIVWVRTTSNDGSGFCPNVIVTSVATMYYIFVAELYFFSRQKDFELFCLRIINN